MAASAVPDKMESALEWSIVPPSTRRVLVVAGLDAVEDAARGGAPPNSGKSEEADEYSIHTPVSTSTARAPPPCPAVDGAGGELPPAAAAAPAAEKAAAKRDSSHGDHPAHQLVATTLTALIVDG